MKPYILRPCAHDRYGACAYAVFSRKTGERVGSVHRGDKPKSGWWHGYLGTGGAADVAVDVPIHTLFQLASVAAVVWAASQVQEE